MVNDMHAEFWIDKWQKAEIGFHLEDYHPMLTRHWRTLGVGAGARVFVPLCGKSLDMIFLLRQGCQVIGNELSPIAIQQFFADQNLQVTSTTVSGITVYEAAGIRLIQGDFFQLDRQTLGSFEAVYDRASLIAMPPDLQHHYAEHLLALAPVAAPILLITLDYDPAEMNGPPFATPADQVTRLFGASFHIKMLERIDALADNPALQRRGLTALSETAWHLRPRDRASNHMGMIW
jgi:thiopurine S-methyltransferase